jgi:Spx/MgsR family transcriptional regulator
VRSRSITGHYGQKAARKLVDEPKTTTTQQDRCANWCLEERLIGCEMTTLYGFKSCDTVKKARKWLDDNGVGYRWFDYRMEKLDPATVDEWFARAGWEAVLNRNSTTFKELPDSEKANLYAATARKMILAETNLIKRPVLDTGKALLFGFRADAYAEALK